LPLTSDHILTLDDIKLLLVGSPGSGKTVGAGSWYKCGPIYFYDWDFRTKPLKKFFPDTPIEYDSFAVGDFPRFRDHFLSLSEAVRTGSMEHHNTTWEFPTVLPKTIVLDSLTFLADAMMQYLLSFRKARKDNPDVGKMKGEDVIRRMGVIDIPAMPEWLGESMGMQQIIPIGKSLPCNFIMTAHYTKSIDISGAAGKIAGVKQKTVITIGNKIAEKIPGFFDEIWSTRAQQGIMGDDPVSYFVRTVPYSDELGKTCLPLSAEIDFTAPETLYDAVKADIERNT
jgi:hypothetical protein